MEGFELTGELQTAVYLSLLKMFVTKISQQSFMIHCAELLQKTTAIAKFGLFYLDRQYWTNRPQTPKRKITRQARTRVTAGEGISGTVLR
jgi:hypothetical protein